MTTGKITLVLKTGGEVTGVPNFTDTQGVELRLPNGTFRWILRAELANRADLHRAKLGGAA